MSAGLPSPAGGPRRIVEVLPVLAALALHAAAHGRAVLAAPAALALLFFCWRGTVTDGSTLRLVIASAVGALAGALALSWSPLPPGPVPAPLLGPLCGMLLALAASYAVARSLLYAWLYAWLLAILSLHAPPTPLLLALLGLLALSTLVSAVAGGVLRPDRQSALGALLFLALLAAGGAGLARLVFASEGTLVQLIGGTIAALVSPAGGGGLGLQESVLLGPRGAVEPDGAALFELSGAGPEKLRGVVLDQWNGVSWTTSPALLRPLAPPPARAGEAEEELRITPLESSGPVLPLPSGARAIEGAQAVFTGGWVARLEEADPPFLRVLRRAGGRPLDEAAPGPELLAVPAVLEAPLLTVAAEALPAAGTARARAGALERYFQAHFTYSLHTDLGGPGHPLITLLRERRPAYCVYFAAAMAALLRVSGIHARMVGGFAPEERDAVTGAVIVRARDAHAWVEAWLPEERRWEAFDPTPAQSREAALGRPARSGWFASAARAVAGSARSFWRSLRRDPAGTLVRSPVAWLIVGGGALFLALRRVRRGRRGRVREAARAGDPELERIYRRYLAALARAELSPLPAETDDELLARVAAARGEQAGAAARGFVERYRRARYRGEARAGLGLAEAVEAVDRAVAAAAPAPQRR